MAVELTDRTDTGVPLWGYAAVLSSEDGSVWRTSRPTKCRAAANAAAANAAAAADWNRAHGKFLRVSVVELADAATVRRLLAEARAQEREACAKLCDPEPVDPWDSYTARNNKATMRLLAQRIRARGDTAPDPRDERIARLTEALQECVDTLEGLQGGCTDSEDGTVEALTIYCPEVIDRARAALEADRG